MGLLGFFGFKKYGVSVYTLYSSIVAQSRNEEFYLKYGVKDTINGRFDLITLHMFIILRRLKKIEKKGETLSQDLFDVMFEDMDKNMREMGVGDLRVGKNVKSLAIAFYGRLKAYDKGLEGLKVSDLDEALKRNLFLDMEPTDNQVLTLSKYLRKLAEKSDKWSYRDIETSNINFGNITLVDKNG
jgi:cytochrome b pre-mRNA-processing protein 3